MKKTDHLGDKPRILIIPVSLIQLSTYFRILFAFYAMYCRIAMMIRLNLVSTLEMRLFWHVIWSHILTTPTKFPWIIQNISIVIQITLG